MLTGMDDVDQAVRAITRDNAVMLRSEALGLGLDDRWLRRATRSGLLARVRHGAYVMGDAWAGLDDVGRHRVRASAVLRTHGERVAASHHTAVALHGLEQWGTELSRVHVTRLDGGAGRTERDVVHHEGVCLPSDLTTVDGWQAVTPVRAVLESAILGGVERGLVVADSGLRHGLFTPAELAEQHTLMESWPGSRHLHLVTRMASGRSASVGESRARFLFWSQGLPMPDLQFEVYDGGQLVGVSDFAWPEHQLLGEFDGRLKYGRYLRPGEDAGDAVFREKRREDLLRALTGWRMVRLTWADLYDPVRTAAYVRGLLRRAA
jgi:hypothetical protein